MTGTVVSMQIQSMISNDEVAQLLANYTMVAFATASIIGPTNSQTTIDRVEL